MLGSEEVQRKLKAVAEKLGTGQVTESQSREIYRTFKASAGTVRKRVFVALQQHFHETENQFSNRVDRAGSDDLDRLINELTTNKE